MKPTEAMTEARKRRLHALRLREEGYTFREIGKALGGVGPERARQLVVGCKRENDQLDNR